MSNLVSALENASFDGFAKVRECGLQGMITVRGDLAAPEMGAAIKGATVKGAAGLVMPQVRQIVHATDMAVAWMSPDELLLMVPYGAVADVISGLETALAGQHFMAINVSDARAVFEVSGPAADEVIAKLAPVDMARFTRGEIRRSRLAQVAAAFWRANVTTDEATGAPTVRIVCFRSVAQYVFDILKTAAEPGSQVGYLHK